MRPEALDDDRHAIVADREHLILSRGQRITWSQFEAIAHRVSGAAMAHDDPDSILTVLVRAGIARHDDTVAVMH